MDMFMDNLYLSISREEYAKKQDKKGCFKILSKSCSLSLYSRFASVPVNVTKIGCISYRSDRSLHRLCGPARIYEDGQKFYYRNNVKILKESLISLLTKEQLALFLINPENF